jgi:hypothetical protein
LTLSISGGGVVGLASEAYHRQIGILGRKQHCDNLAGAGRGAETSQRNEHERAGTIHGPQAYAMAGAFA